MRSAAQVPSVPLELNQPERMSASVLNSETGALESAGRLLPEAFLVTVLISKDCRSGRR